MLRRLFGILVPFLVTACAEYEGEAYDQVVNGTDVELYDELPDGYEIIGEVSADTVNTTDGSFSEYLLWCGVDDRLERRMRRVAARNGGELLIGFECTHYEEEDTSEWHDDPETIFVETELTCWTECWAEVARWGDEPHA